MTFNDDNLQDFSLFQKKGGKQYEDKQEETK